MYKLLFFVKYGKFSTIISSHFIPPIYLSSLFLPSHYVCVMSDDVSQVPEALFIFLNSFLSAPHTGSSQFTYLQVS